MRTEPRPHPSRPARAPRRPLAAVAAVAGALLVAAGLGACGGAEPYAAKVNDATISQADLEGELDAIKGNEEYFKLLTENGVTVEGSGEGTFDAAFVAQVLTRQILLELVHQEVQERDLEITEFDLQQARASVSQQVGSEEIFEAFPEAYTDRLVERNAEVTKLQADVAGEEIGEDDIEAFYEENKDELFTVTCVRHILVEPQDLAGQLRAQIAGGADFAEIAKAQSKDPGSGQQGGDLGCLSDEEIDQFVPEFAEATRALPTGELSQPVQTQFGFHLIQVTERRPLPLEEVSGQIRSQLLQPSQQEFQEEIERIVDEADVEVNPRYGEFIADREQGGPAVRPPEAPELPTTTTSPPGGGFPVVPPGAGGGAGGGSEGGPEGGTPAAPDPSATEPQAEP